MWRIKAMYSTFCVRCADYLDPDTWIVEIDGTWVHEVCPKHDNEFAPAGKGQCHRRNTMQEQYVTIEQYRRGPVPVGNRRGFVWNVFPLLDVRRVGRHIGGANGSLEDSRTDSGLAEREAARGGLKRNQ